MRFSPLILTAALALAPAASLAEDFVHPAGWIVDGNCLDGRVVTAAKFRSALDEAARKFSPTTRVSEGGCLADYNPGWAKKLSEFLKSNPIRIACPEQDSTSRRFFEYERVPGSGGVLRIRNIASALAEGGTGLAGAIFHESLHAYGADNLPLEQHNQAGELPQYVFVTDRVYGTEALCFFGGDPATKKKVNVLQCRAAVNYDNDRPDQSLCSGFNTAFYDTVPIGLLKSE
ncbi:MAG: hypothetical protein ACHQ49_07080 [Elusimicrobiota bacterium]